MNSEIKTRLKQLENRLKPLWEDTVSPDALTISLWEWGALLESLTQEERVETAAELGISLDALAELEKQCREPRRRKTST